MQDKNAAFKGDMIEVCENRMLYNYSSKLGYYNEHNNNDGKICNNSIKKNKTTDLNDFTTSRNYFVVPYIYGTHVVVILATTAISPHLLPISFYLINKKTTYFNEWKLFSYSTVYSFLIHLIIYKKLRMIMLVIHFFIKVLTLFGYMLTR